MKFAETVKSNLLQSISNVAANSEQYVKVPGKDFTRKRKLDFETAMKLIISMEGNTTKLELLDFFQYDENAISASAFNQQRDKLLPSAFEKVFYDFNHTIPSASTYRGYKLLACDGSSINFSRNPQDVENYFLSRRAAVGVNLMHLNVLYNLLDRKYEDALIQSGHARNEYAALCHMVDRFDSNPKERCIFIADRGYPSYNVFAHIAQKGEYFLIRTKDIASSGMLYGLPLPETDEFDFSITMILARSLTKETRANPQLYKRIYNQVPFDYLPMHSKKQYPLSLRIVRFLLPNGSYECLVTNLSEEEFSQDDLKKLYSLRWGVETSFRELKYAIGLVHFHSKKPEFIKQEIWARLTLYNFCEIITIHTTVKTKNKKHSYQVNFTMAIHLCRYFLRLAGNTSLLDIEVLIGKYILPIRKDRKNSHRHERVFRNPKSFWYRIV